MPYFGRNIRTGVFGQSHAAAIGVTIDGLPAGEAVDAVELEAFMARRAPEQNRMTTQRREADRPEREPIFRALAHRIITSRRLRTQFSRSSEKSRETSDHQRPQHQFSGHSRTGHLRQHNLQGPVRNTRDLVRRCRRLMRAFPVQP